MINGRGGFVKIPASAVVVQGSRAVTNDFGQENDRSSLNTATEKD